MMDKRHETTPAEQLATLIQTQEDAEAAGTARDSPACALPRRDAITALARQGQTDHLLYLLASQELQPLHRRVLRWRASACHNLLPLSEAELCHLQQRGHGASPLAGVPLPAHLAETYRAFSLWYWRTVLQHTAPFATNS